MNDGEIIQQVLAGDINDFGRLVEKYQKPVVGLIYNMTRDHHLSEDLGQEVFVEAYRSLMAFDPARGRFSTWLYRITRNKTLNALKKMQPLLLPEVPETPHHRNPGHDAATGEFHAELDRILDRLPVKLRLVFVWAEIEGLSGEEIAEIEGVPVGTVKSRLNRAKQQLQAALRKQKVTPYE